MSIEGAGRIPEAIPSPIRSNPTSGPILDLTMDGAFSIWLRPNAVPLSNANSPRSSNPRRRKLRNARHKVGESQLRPTVNVRWLK
jgi:hypothetical protein